MLVMDPVTDMDHVTDCVTEIEILLSACGLYA